MASKSFEILDALHVALTGRGFGALKSAEFSSGPLRMAGSSDGRVLSVLEQEYVTGTGSEVWGYSNSPGHGLLSHPISASSCLNV